MRGILALRFSSASLFLSIAFFCAAADAQTLVHFDLPAQSLAQSLKSIGTAANIDVGFNASQVAGLLAPPLKANLTVDGALTRVLVGTGLRLRHLDDHTIVIASIRVSAAETAKSKLELVNASEPVPPVDQGNAPQAEAAADSSDKPAPSNRNKDLDEIIVTGTNIRGVTDSASPILVFSREDIDRTGLGTLQSFFEKLPQNFSSISENTISTVAGSVTSGNGASGSAINLRGLGNDSTLLLVNGHRVATSGDNGDIADVSLIPLSAVDRVEIVTDGASAIYGSDAVGGVVNVILRKDFDGAETRARYGSVSEGASHETQIGQTFGKTWAGGSAVLSYEFLDRTPLSAADRDFSRTAIQPTDLLPEQVRHGVFATLQQDFSSGWSLFADGTYGHRATNEFISSLGFSQQDPADVESYSGVLGGRVRLWDKTNVEISASYAGSNEHLDAIQSGTNATTPETIFDIDTSTLSFDAKIDGSLGFLKTGELSYAVGAQFRHETLESSEYSFPSASGTSFGPHRDIEAAFAEIRVPLVGGSAPASPILELNLADRYEHYSDFGATNNPQLGLIGKPISGVKFRGTLGTSFKAPLLNDLNPTPSQVVVLPEFDPPGGRQSCFPFNTSNTCSNAIIALGGNPLLNAEKARTWTAGFDVKPLAIPGFSASATYYNIYSRDRITDLDSLFPLTVALQNASILGSSIVQRNPSAALVQQLSATPTFINPFNIDLASLGAFVDYRFHNLSSVRTDGIDLDLAYKTAVFAGEFETGIDGTYILKFDNRVTSATPEASLLNTPFNPINLRLRPRAELRIGPISAAAFLNYTNSYEDNRGSTPVPVASWTTVDVNLGYTCGNSCGFLQHATVLAGVTNIANRAPPYLANVPENFGVNFDGTNANALGRFIYLQISSKW